MVLRERLDQFIRSFTKRYGIRDNAPQRLRRRPAMLAHADRHKWLTKARMLARSGAYPDLSSLEEHLKRMDYARAAALLQDQAVRYQLQLLCERAPRLNDSQMQSRTSATLSTG